MSQETFPGFELTDESEIGVSALAAAQIAEAAAAHPRLDTTDGTDRWLEEIGGGERRESLAANPPKVSLPNQPYAHHSRRGGRSYSERSDSELDLNWKVTEPLSLSPEQLKRNQTGAVLARRKVAEAHFDATLEKSGRDAKQQAALLRAEQERRTERLAKPA